MLAEFVEKLASLTRAETEFKVHRTSNLTEVVRYPDGTIQEFPFEPSLRSFDTSDLAAFTNLLRGCAALVCVSPTQVVGYFDAVDRRESVKLSIVESKSIIALCSLGAWSKQRNVVNLLRDDLFDAAEPGLLPALRGLDFSRRNDGSRTVEHGCESLGRSIEETVQSKHGELSEFYSFDVPLFANFPFDEFRVRLNASFDCDATNETLRFNLRGDELAQAYQRGTVFVRDRIVDELDDAMVVIAEHTPLSR